MKRIGERDMFTSSPISRIVGAGDGDRAAGVDVDGAGARLIDIGGGEIVERRVSGDAVCVHRDRLLPDPQAARADLDDGLW